MTDTEQQVEETTATPSRRGRPRPESTIERDAQVLSALEDGPKTRAQLVEATGQSQTYVYLSLYRLRKDGKVTKARDGANHVWTVVTDEDTEDDD